MKVLKVEQREDKRMYLEIEVDSEKFEAAMEKSYKKNVKKINIPGFRKGHAPRKIMPTRCPLKKNQQFTGSCSMN